MSKVSSVTAVVTLPSLVESNVMKNRSQRAILGILMALGLGCGSDAPTETAGTGGASGMAGPATGGAGGAAAISGSGGKGGAGVATAMAGSGGGGAGKAGTGGSGPAGSGGTTVMMDSGMPGMDGGGATSGAGQPAAPSMLMAQPLSGGVHLTWKDNSSDEEMFMIMKKEGTSAFATLAMVPSDTVQYHDTAVSSGKAYTYMVHAMKGDELSDSSNEVMISIP